MSLIQIGSLFNKNRTEQNTYRHEKRYKHAGTVCVDCGNFLLCLAVFVYFWQQQHLVQDIFINGKFQILKSASKPLKLYQLHQFGSLIYIVANHDFGEEIYTLENKIRKSLYTFSMSDNFL